MSEAAPAAKTLEEIVREIVAESLSRPLSEVTPEANLMNDLGAESLDFLDIVFRIERAFDIQITRGEMERAARGDLTEEEFAPAGVISEKGLERLRQLMPEARDRVVTGLRPTQVLSLFSVRTFVNLAEGKTQGKSL